MQVTVRYKNTTHKIFEKVKYIAELLDGYRILLEDPHKSYTINKTEMDVMEIKIDEK